MGDVVSIDARRSLRQAAQAGGAAGRAKATFSFDLASPFTYLAAERVDRLFPGVTWRPARVETLHAAGTTECEALITAAQARAQTLGMPLVWPEGFPAPARVAMRVAAFAAQTERGAAFVLAASRLAFCGGYDLDDPDVLADAAAAAGIGSSEMLGAAGDPAHDDAIQSTGLALAQHGADRLPVLDVGGTLFCGEDRIAAAAACSLGSERRSQLPSSG